MSTDVRGRIAIDVQFWDRTSTEGVQSLKTIALQDSTEYTTGKVAVVSGTCGTAGESISVNPTSYKDSAGNQVAFSTISRIGLQGSSAVRLNAGIAPLAVSKNGHLTITSNQLDNDLAQTLTVRALSGTASYTLVLYGT